MTREEKFDACKNFMNRLADILKDSYEMIGSCNHDTSIYLIPIGTESQLNYYAKPLYSFRTSDHWNWYTSLKRCPNPKTIQCYSVDIPAPKHRETNWKESEPRKGCQVSIYLKDKKYHCVYGEKWNHAKKCWDWIETTPEDVISQLKQAS